MDKNLETILRHVINRTNWQGDPGARDEVDRAYAELFPEGYDREVEEPDRWLTHPPASSAPEAEWRAWATHNDLRTVEEAAAMNKAELQALTAPL